jgi:hypothetical protein
MSRTRKLIIAFWIFIGCMLLWQFYDYNQGLKEASVEHPTQQHFWFTNSVATAPGAPAQAHRDGPDVQQTGFSVENNAPSTGNFTCHVTLKNVGNAKAVGVQVSVRPYRGITLDDQDEGHARPADVTLSDSDPISQFGQWVTFPDLAPGESSTQKVFFLSRTDVIPGTNPNPEIQFQKEKAKP